MTKSKVEEPMKRKVSLNVEKYTNRINEEISNEENAKWEQRRYELAKSAMQGILANQEYKIDKEGCYRPYIQNLIKDSISFADEMINSLKMNNYE